MKYLEKLQTNKILVATLAFMIGWGSGALFEQANFMNINSVLLWSCGLGVFIVLWLHGTSFFSTDNLPWYYSRLYGVGFGLIYTSAVFLMFTYFYAGQSNTSFNTVAYSFIVATVFYNFVTNNYKGIEKEHLIARKMLDKQMEKDRKAQEKSTTKK